MYYRKDFPFFKENVAYLDSAATSQKPEIVIEAFTNYYKKLNANSGRGSYDLSIKSKEIIDNTRVAIKKFLNLTKDYEVVFTKNATEAMNIIAYSYGLNFLNKDDEIYLGISNHHANIVPWHFVKQKNNIDIKYMQLDDYGNLDIDKDFSNTKLVSISTAVNTTGIIQDYEKLIENVKKKSSAKIILDISQSIAHMKHDFKDLDVDFMVFSGHKIYAMQGVGVLIAKKDLLNMMPPFIYGGDMIEYVEKYSSTFADIPTKFEGGTMDAASIYSLNVALKYIEDKGFSNMIEYEKKLFDYLITELKKLDFIDIYYLNNKRVPVVSFNVKGVHSHDTSFILNEYGVSIRSGQHCSAPLLKFMGVNSTCRVSISIYNIKEDIDKLIIALKKVKEVFLNE